MNIGYNLLSDEDKKELMEIENEMELLEKEGEQSQEETQTINAIIKDPKIAIDKIVEYKGDELKKFEFRPEQWSQFIGQMEAKERAKTIQKKIDKGLKAHFLVDGIKGHGKTTYVELLAKDINAHIIKRIGKQIDEDSIVDIINEINTCKDKVPLLFIDELDSTDWKVIKILNPIIESFEISGKRIRPFVFAGATINKHILIKNNPDTLDRIPTHIKFKRYDASEIKQILKQYKDQLYSQYNVPDEVFDLLSKNCKFNPRTSIALLEEFIVEEDINKVLKNCHILKDGLTEFDIKLLKILSESSRAMGANALSMRAGLAQNEYLREFEPYLVEYGYIERVPSRKITEKGLKLLREV